jgi:hypothetical protein
MNTREERLLQLREAIETDKQKKSRLEGAIEQLQKQLQDDFNISSKKEINKKIDKWKIELEEENKNIDVSYDKLEKLYEW